jgi:hypothetical protein
MITPGVLPNSFAIAPISRISPSKFVGLKSCWLRELWASNRVPPLLPVNARAHVGTIVHEMLAAAGRGELSSEAEVESYWVTLVNKTEREMLSHWLEHSLVPLSKSVRSYSVDALRAINKAREIALWRKGHAVGDVAVGAGYGFELWVHSPDEKVGGYIDHAYHDGAGIVIRDYKSGYVLEPTDGGGEVKETFAVQLRLYAALYSVTFGKWPNKLELSPTQGPSVVVPFDPAECVNLVHEAKSLLDEINATVVRSNEKHVSPATLASPSAETCSHCVYRPSCTAYVNIEKQSDAGWPADVRGIIKNIQPLMNGHLALILETPNGIEVIRGISSGERHPALASVSPGQPVAVFNLQKSFPGVALQEGLYTTIYRYSC